MNSFYQAVSGGVSVARLVYSQARMIGYGADAPGFFVPVFVVWIFLSGWKSEDKVFIVSLFLQ